MNCSKCNAPIPEDAVFCSECGTPVEVAVPAPEPAVFCAECGEALVPGDAFCANCGKPIANAEPEKPAVPVEQKPVVREKKPMAIPSKVWMIAGAAVALIAVVVLVLALIGGGKSDSYALYIKDEQIQALEVPGGRKPLEVTSDLTGDSYADSSDLNNMYLVLFTYLSSDGKRLFYPDKIEEFDYGWPEDYTLYCRDITNGKKDPIKIDSGMYFYNVNEQGTLVTYMKDGKLYQHDLKDKTKIAGDVIEYCVSEDGKLLVYLEGDEDEGDLYVAKNGKDPEKIASSVTDLNYHSADCQTILYSKDDSLYLLKVGKEPVKIDSDVASVRAAYDSGACYYTKEEETEVSLWSLIEDDMASDDYDYIREWLQEDTYSDTVTSLYYFDGKQSQLLAEDMISFFAEAADVPVVTYRAMGAEDEISIRFSEYLDAYDFSTLYYTAQRACADTYVAAEDAVSLIQVEDINGYNSLISDDGKHIYLDTDYNAEDGTYSLYHITLAGAQIKSTELLDEDVDTFEAVGSSVMYWKDVSNDCGEFYMDGVKVDDDVYVWNCAYDADNDKVYYFADYNINKNEGTLMCYNGKKSVSIQDDVCDFGYTEDGTVLFLYDRSQSSFESELWSWNGRKAVQLDDDVLNLYVVRN